MTALLAMRSRRRLWWLPPTLLALAVVAADLITGWQPRIFPAGYWALILAVGLSRFATGSDVRVHAAQLGQVLLWAVPVLLLGFQFAWNGPRPGRWDWQLLTGVLAFVVAVEMADRIPQRLALALDRLRARGVLDMTADSREQFTARSEHLARTWSVLGGITLALVILAAWMAFGHQDVYVARLPELDQLKLIGLSPPVLFECVCGWIAGEKLGGMIACALSWRPYKYDDISWRLFPGHPDGAGGFKPIGDFFFYQSVVASIPAIYLAAWLWILPLIGEDTGWERVYPWLLGVAILAEVLTFIWPMRSVHVLMQQKKALLQVQADELSSRIESLQQRLRTPGGAARRQQIKDSIADLTGEYQRIEQVPTWPVSSSVRRRFSLSNLALLLPFVSYVVGGTTLWQVLSRAIHGH